MSKKLFTIQNKIAELRRLRRYALELVHAAAVKGVNRHAKMTQFCY